MLKLFIEYIKGYMEEFEKVKKVFIKKIDNKNVLEIVFENSLEKIHIHLTDIKLCFLINQETLEEYFRYEK